MSILRSQAAEALRRLRSSEELAKPARKEGVSYSDLSFSVDEEMQERIERDRDELGRKLGLKK